MAEIGKKQIPLDAERLQIAPEGEAHLLGMRCNTCSVISYPRSPLCPNCGETSVEGITLSDQGKIWTYTVVHVSYGSMILTPPYVAAFVELSGGGYVHAPVVDCEPEEVGVGMDVQMVLVKTSEDEDFEKVTYAFKPAAAG